jgi:hypothetical protein
MKMNLTIYNSHKKEKIFESISTLTPLFSDFSNIFILPMIAFYSCINNIICIITFANRRLIKNPTYKYMLYISISDFIYSLINMFIFTIRCGVYCSFGYSYGSKLFETYVYQFLAKVFECSTILADIKLSFIRLDSFKKTNVHKKKLVKLHFLVFFLAAIFLIAPSAVIFKEVKLFGYLLILNGSNQTTYEPLYLSQSTQLGTNIYVKSIIISLSLIRGLVLLNFLSVINLIVFIKFRIYMNNKKKHLTTPSLAAFIENNTNDCKSNRKSKENELSQKELKATSIVILLCLWRYLGDLQNSIAPILFLYLSSYSYSVYASISNGVQWLFHGSNLYLHYFFNDEFKKTCLIVFGLKKYQSNSNLSIQQYTNNNKTKINKNIETRF